MRISDWSSDVCSSDLMRGVPPEGAAMTLSVADARAVLAEHFPTARAQLAAQVESDRIAALRRPAATSRFELGRDILERLDGRDGPAAARSAERRVGKECVGTSRSRWSP